MPGALLVVLMTGRPAPAPAAPLDQQGSWEGAIDYFVTGAPLASDTDGSNTVDTLAQPASVDVGTVDIPAGADPVVVYLYWASTITDQQDCSTVVHIDDQVDLTLPAAAQAVAVTADECLCIPGATSYDIQACRADITAHVIVSGIHGTYTVDGLDALIRGYATDNASFSLVFVFEEPGALPPRRIALFDGLEELYRSSRIMQLTGLDADTPAHGDLAWYVLDGDVGGDPPEEVLVTGQPGGASTVPFDALNPVDNPMNRTINTTNPPQTGTVGVDIDRLDVSTALTGGDTSVDMEYTAGGDKYWVVYNIVGINVYRALVHSKTSYKIWSLQDDADGDGYPSPGDTIRYTIHLDNLGTAPGYVTVSDPLPPGFVSFVLVDSAGGTDVSTTDTMVIEDIFLAAGGTADVLVDMEIAPSTDGSVLYNVVDYDTGPDGTQGQIISDPLTVGAPPGPDAGVPDAGGLDGAVIPEDGAVTQVDGSADAQVDGSADAQVVQDSAVTPDSGSGPDAIAPGLDGAAVDAGEDPSAQPSGCHCQAGQGEGTAGLLMGLFVGLILLVRRRRINLRGDDGSAG